MAKILYVEDDPVLGKGLTVHLQASGHDVVWETTIAKAREAEATNPFEVLLLDVNLPDGSGLDFCHELRKRGSKLPVIVLTARSDDDSLVTGFECGANDYMKKPFSNRELVTRIQYHLKEPFMREVQIRNGPVLILLNQRKVLVNGTEIDFNRREFDIFVHLVKNPGTIMSREQLITAIGSENMLDRTIDSHLSHIRGRLKTANASQVTIRSVYGVGYTMDIE